jgi:hypothetical protein
MTDQLTTCPRCKCDGCYVVPINEVHNAYSCFGCGFATNDLMRVDEFNFEEYEAELPHLYVDLKDEDEHGRVWYPQVINVEDRGTIFANGPSKDEWQWAAIKTIKLTEKDKQNPRFKNKEYKSDSSSLKNFGLDFIEACDYIGVFDIK